MNIKSLQVLLLMIFASFSTKAQYPDNDLFPLKTFELCEIKGFPYFDDIEQTMLTYLRDNNHNSATIVLYLMHYNDLASHPSGGYIRSLFPIDIENKDESLIIVAVLSSTVSEDCPWYYKRGKVTFKISETFKPWVVPLNKYIKIREPICIDGTTTMWFFLIADGKLHTIRKDNVF